MFGKMLFILIRATDTSQKRYCFNENIAPSYQMLQHNKIYKYIGHDFQITYQILYISI